MIKIEDNTTYILYKNKNSFSYTFQLKHTTPEKTENLFIESLSNQIPNSFLYENENDNDKLSIIFTATTVTPITAEIVKGNIKQMIKSLSKQLEYLHNNNLAFYGFDLDDIIVINDTQFLFVNNKYIQTLDKERTISFYGPFTKPYFSSPELIDIKCLPARIDYQTSYYSLGALIVYYLFGYNLQDLKRESQEEKVFESILHLYTSKTPTLSADLSVKCNSYHALEKCKGVNTKLYWFLKRCINDNPKKRILLYN
jgi:ATP-dependent exoDNAse (exonuclease V) beta subunit